MKLLTHNLLSSHVRGVGPRGFPLRLQVPAPAWFRAPLLGRIREPGSGPCLTKPLRPQATEVRINPVEFNPDFVARMIPKVEWAALLEAADTVRTPTSCPPNCCAPSKSGLAAASCTDR